MRTLFPSRGRLTGNLRFPIVWQDLIVIPIVLLALLALTMAFRGAGAHFDESSPDLTVSLDGRHLPYYGLRSMFRMFLAVLLSLSFTFTVATLAAKSRRAEKVLIPTLDFLQSLPILGFLTVTTAIFLGIFRGSLLGLEAASIFAIFTSQVWNMTFSFYHSLITLPRELEEASSVMRQSRWHRFWKLEVPFAMPSLVWNTMMSVSGGWFFVVASEVITVIGRDRDQSLPGIGSYIALAIDQGDGRAMVYAGVALLLLVLIYDQVIFRPIVAWAEKFKFEQSEAQETPKSWMLTLLRRSRFAAWIARLPQPVTQALWRATARGDRSGYRVERVASSDRRERAINWIWNLVIVITIGVTTAILASFMFGPGFGFADGKPLAPNRNVNVALDAQVAAQFRAAGVISRNDQTVYVSDICAVSQNGRQVSPELAAALTANGVDAPSNLVDACTKQLAPAGKVTFPEVLEVVRYGIYTMLRVTVMIALSILVWTPIGVWIGLRPRAAQIVQPFAQFAAAFPANLLFPLFVIIISRLALEPNIFLAPLMVLGAQWYILFNVIAGTIAIPNDLKEAARVVGLRGWARWRVLILPAIFPAFVTGGITASGGSWNASIVAEIASWGSITLVATGLGAYIARWSSGEINPHVALGMLTMGLLVLGFNRLLWRRLYLVAETRFRLD